MNTLHLRLLGPLDITDDHGRPVHLPMRKEEALLAYLAVEHSHAHSRDSLMGLFWPDAPPDNARLSLRVTLSRLKKRLAAFDVAALFRATQHDVQFTVYGCAVDVVDFTRALRIGEMHDHRRDEVCARCHDAMAGAVSLYRGTFLDGFFVDGCQLFDEWLFVQRERYRVQVLGAMAQLCAYHLHRNAYDEALEYAVRQTEIDPLREQAHQQIMQIHLAQGHRTDALRQFEICRAVLQDELGVAPAQETADLQQQILAAGNSPHPQSPRAAQPTEHSAGLTSHLPRYLTPFVGRNRELALLEQRILRAEYRIITLTGAGGMGKSRLAVEGAQRSQDHFADGVHFVPLASVQQVDDVVNVIAATLEIAYQAGARTPQQQLLDWLAPRRLLLVLDNMEHLLPAASLLIEMLEAAPQLVLLVTSREPLGLHAEDRIHVGGLPVPESETVDEAGRYAAVRLFVDRAYRVDKRFHLSEDNVAAIVEICRLVDGRPLAVELAAARKAERSCWAIAHAIRAGLDFLAADLPDLPARHRSIRTLFEQSRQTLTAGQQACFSRLSLFHNPFSVEAAVAVAGGSVPVLTHLHKVHLLQHHESTGHFDMHELVRQFAAETLAQTVPERSALLRRHAEYFLNWLADHDDMLRGIQPRQHAEAIQGCLADVRAAWQWATTEQAVDLLAAALPVLGAFFTLRGMNSEAERLYRATLAQIPGADAGLRSRLLVRLGAALEKQGNIEEAGEALEEGLVLAQALDDCETTAYAHWHLARLAATAGSVSHAIRILQQAIAGLPSNQALTERAELLIYLGTLAAQQGDHSTTAKSYTEARRIVARTNNQVQEQRLLLYRGVDAIDQSETAARHFLTEALALAPYTGDRTAESRILNALGFIAARWGNYAEAIDYHTRGLAICTAAQDALQQNHALHNLCVDYYHLGDYQEAYRFGKQALAIADRNDLREGIGYAQLHLGHVLAEMGLFLDAEEALLAARNAFTQLERTIHVIEAEAGLAHVERLVGDLPAARKHVDRVLEFLDTQELAGSDEPSRIYLHCYQVLRACRDRRAGPFLADAHAYVQNRAARLDLESRHRFLQNVPANREILRIWEASNALPQQ